MIDQKRGPECIRLVPMGRYQVNQGSETTSYRYHVRIEYHSNAELTVRRISEIDEKISDLLDDHSATDDADGYVYHEGNVDEVRYDDEDAPLVLDYGYVRTEVTG